MHFGPKVSLNDNVNGTMQGICMTLHASLFILYVSKVVTVYMKAYMHQTLRSGFSFLSQQLSKTTLDVVSSLSYSDTGHIQCCC